VAELLAPAAQSILRAELAGLLPVFVDLIPPRASLIGFAERWRETRALADERSCTLELSGLAPVDVSLRAQGDGWRLVEEDEGSALLESGERSLTLEPTAEGVRVRFEEPWPADAHPPIEASPALARICGGVLGLTEFPSLMERELRLFPVRTLREAVRFSVDRELGASLRHAGYQSPDGRTWTSAERRDDREWEAVVHTSTEGVEVVLQTRTLPS